MANLAHGRLPQSGLLQRNHPMALRCRRVGAGPQHHSRPRRDCSQPGDVRYAAEGGSELSCRDATGTNTMAETVIDCPSVAKPVSRPRSSKPATVSASALALHLDCSRTYIGKLEAEGVIQRQGDGFPLDRSRVAYLRYLRREKRPSPRGNRRQTKFARKRSMSSAASAAILTSGLRPALPSVTRLPDRACSHRDQPFARAPPRPSAIDRKRSSRQQTELLHRIFDTRCIRAALTNRFIKIGHLTVNRVLDFHDDYRAISSAPINHAVPESTKASAATYRFGVQHDQTFHRRSAVL